MARLNHYNQQRKKFLQKVIGFFVVIFLIYLLGGILLRPLSGPLSFIARPIWWANEGVSTVAQVVFDFFRSQNRLAIENRKLSIENEKLRAITLSQNQAEKDNKYLRSLFGRTEKNALPIVGEVFLLPNFVPYQTLLIDLGKNNLTRNIKVGDLAVVNGVVLVGRIAEVNNWYSKVRLFSAENNISVVIGPTNIPGLASGSGAGNFVVTLPKASVINIGDRVVAPLLNNLLIGVVRHVGKNPNQPNQTILVKTPINLWQLKWLEIYDVKI